MHQKIDLLAPADRMDDEFNDPVITVEGGRTCIPIGLQSMAHNASISQLGESSNAYTAPMYAMHVALKNLQCHLQKSEDKVKQLTRQNTELAEENFHLKKERHRFEKQLAEAKKVNQELQEKLLGMSGLMRKLSQVTVENQNLEMRVLALTEEVDSLQAKLARTAAAFHTYPWSDVYASCGNQYSSSFRSGKRLGMRRVPIEDGNGDSNDGCHSLENKSGFSESWEEISQKLLFRLKEEMKELQELDCRLAQEVSASCDVDSHCSEASMEGVPAVEVKQHANNEQEEDEQEIAMQSVNHLKSNLGQMKNVLLKQQRVLRNLVSKLATTNLAGFRAPLPGGDGLSKHQNDISVPFSIQEAKELLHRLAKAKANHGAAESNVKNSPKQIARTKSEPSQDAKNSMDGRSRLVRPSDETVRQYFTQQLTKSTQLMHYLHVKTPEDDEGPQDIRSVLQNLEACIGRGENKNPCDYLLVADLHAQANAQLQTFGLQKESNICATNNNGVDAKTSSRLPKSEELGIRCNGVHNGSQKTSPPDDESVCPMCQAVFPKQIPQEEFEAHVMGHFEFDPTLLEQYEVV